MHTHILHVVVRRRRHWVLAAVVLLGTWARADDTTGPGHRHAPSSSGVVVVAAGSSTADPARLNRPLDELEEQLRTRTTGYALASRYRARCAAARRHDRSIKFFQELLANGSGDDWVRIELASAYVDKIPTYTGLTAFVSRGTLARKSLGQLDPVIANDRNSWIAHYCRGTNHLYWPRVLGHATNAITDFQRCIELQQPDTPGSTKPYYVMVYTGLGDAFAKAKQYDQARQAWRDGLKRFPDSKELKERLAVQGDSALLEFVEARRSLDKPVDTDLSFLDDD